MADEPEQLPEAEPGAPEGQPLAPEPPRLRVGLLLPGVQKLPAWQRRLVECISGSRHVEVVALVVPEEGVGAKPTPEVEGEAMVPAPAKDVAAKPFARVPAQGTVPPFAPVNEQGGVVPRPRFARRPPPKLLALWAKAESRVVFVKPDPMAAEELPTLPGGVPVIAYTPVPRRPRGQVPREVRERLERLEVAVWVRLDFPPPDELLLATASEGVWTLRCGARGEWLPDEAGLREVPAGEPVCVSVLWIQRGVFDEGRMLARSVTACHPASVTVTRARVLWKSLHLIPRHLEQLAKKGPEDFYFAVRARDAALAFDCAPARKEPGTWRQAGQLGAHLGRLLGEGVRDAFRRKQWYMLMALGPDVATAPALFKPLLPPDRSISWADPFPVYRNGEYAVFFEEQVAGKPGRIAACLIDRDGRVSAPRTVIEREYHLSYPFVFQHEGVDYLIPESSQRGTVEIYRCQEWPWKWELWKVPLRKAPFLDSTLFQHEGRWWLFANIAAHPGASTWDELYAFYSDNPVEGRWKPHALNPIVSDVRRARPAGRVFRYRDRLYRPAQDCSRRYGYAVRFQQILRLSPEEYREAEVAALTPDWEPGIIAAHTFNYEAGLTVIDAARWVRR